MRKPESRTLHNHGLGEDSCGECRNESQRAVPGSRARCTRRDPLDGQMCSLPADGHTNHRVRGASAGWHAPACKPRPAPDAASSEDGRMLIRRLVEKANAVEAPRVIAECWTCARLDIDGGDTDYRPMPLTDSVYYGQTKTHADEHRAAGHNVRPVARKD